MNFKFINLTYVLILSLLIASCSSDDDSSTPTNTVQKSAVIENYANIVIASYQEAITDAQALETAINTFVADPTDINFAATKTAWRTARESYGPTEAYRFADGPIDTGATEDIEGYLNSWPLDEVFIDYVNGDANSGIINDLTKTISKEELVGLNGFNNSEANVSIGYHAIEFLLWGQDATDPSNLQPGQRPYTDFVDGGTASNQNRRRDYLAVCADLLTDHLQVMIDQWNTNGAYRSTFLALDQDVALKNMLKSIAELSGSELAVERMEVALNNVNQEDEHSCFSDNTHRDIRLNLDGVANVYRGSYGSINGSSLEDLIAEANPTLGASVSTLLATAEAAVNATGTPFDFAISDATESVKIATAIQALKDFSDELVLAAAALGITINF
ncbi:imelysin family protein [Ichthyenterobacterium magnum]|uniref:Putative iron-regulated protein n=1 Tax=Ichthyenterobacterium magnum TaxID=1230530 RepID=A0A420DMB0_9FLAO|nr:imelysin family protein [Ichthyenterobacterium magnum]RKE95426.1 putative iron-regulated protein [Ichthyenterobacterium magnum]